MISFLDYLDWRPAVPQLAFPDLEIVWSQLYHLPGLQAPLISLLSLLLADVEGPQHLLLDILVGHQFLVLAARGKSSSGLGGEEGVDCLLYTSPSPRDQRGSRMPSSA